MSISKDVLNIVEMEAVLLVVVDLSNIMANVFKLIICV